MFDSLSIARKIYLSLAIIVAGYLATMVCVIIEGTVENSRLTTVSMVLFPASQLSRTALTAFEQQTRAYEEAVTVGDRKLLDVAKESGEAAAASLAGIVRKGGLPAKEMEECRRVAQQLGSYTEAARGVYADMASGRMDQVARAGELARQAGALKQAMAGLTANLSRRLQTEVASVQSRMQTGLMVNGVACVAVVILAIAMVSLAVRSTVRRIGETIERLRDIAEGEGDLTSRLDCGAADELGELAACFNRFVEKLHGIILQISHSSGNVADAAARLNHTANEIAEGSVEVASQAGTVATASEEMAATSGDIARTCLEAAHSATRAIEVARDGSLIVRKTVEGMEKIADRVRSSAGAIDGLGARSDQIGAIIGTIEDIADQTNLLALNAAIEAARAGEQGRGFAVVADEVRALAERTAAATREIGAMIRSIQSETANAVCAMEEGVREVEQGTAEAERSGRALDAIIDRIEHLAMQVSQMASAAEEQTGTTAEITNNIQSISEVVARNAEDARGAAGESSELLNLAQSQQELVALFKVA